MEKIAILASGNGSNAQHIVEYFSGSDNVKVEIILSNNPNAFVLQRASALDISSVVFTRDDFYHSEKVSELLVQHQVTFIVLAGFLWLIPQNLLNAYPNRIVNIHPALLPGYGGKGMFGMKVHEAVINEKEKESGITIHYVNEKYDEGQIIFQANCTVSENDTPESLAAKVHELEYRYYPEVIAKILKNF